MAKKPANNSRARRISYGLVTVGILCLGLWFSHAYTKFQALSIQAADVQTPSTVERKPNVTHISIPWRVDVAIEEAHIVGGRWTISERTASHLATSARPGEGGNIIIYGHNTREILGNIRVLTNGEIITLDLEDGTKRQYRVDSMHEIAPTDVKFLQPTDEEILTLYTCSGFWDRMRFIVRAKPI